MANYDWSREDNHNWQAAPVERSDTFDILDYDLNIDLTSFNQRLLKGKAIITFEAKLPGQTALNLDLLDLTVDSVLAIDGSHLAFSYASPLLNIQFADTLEQGVTYSVTVFYYGTPKTSPSGFGGFYFEDGIAYNLGIGLTDDPHNFGRSWFPCFDNFVERSTYTYRVLAPENFTTYCVGHRIQDTLIQNVGRYTEYRMDQQIPTYLSAIASSTYIDYTYNYNSIYGDLPVQLVSKPGDLNNVKASFINLDHAIDALESWYGKYPFERVGYVMTSRGAMEHPGNIAFPVSSTSNGTESRRLYSHEMTHLWWGDLTTLKTQADMWIKEGNAEYGSHLFTEALEGRSAMEDLLKDNNNTVFTTAHVQDKGYLPLSPMPKRITYGVTTYNKGAMVLHCLRGYLGDDLFRSSQQKVLQEFAYKNLTAQTYRDALSDASGVDLTDFFDRWVLDSGYYDFVIVDFKSLDFSEYTHVLTIRQKLLHSSGFCKDAPVSVTFVDRDNKLHTEKVICTGETTDIYLKLQYEPIAVFINIPMTLNLAQFSQMTKVTSNTGINVKYGEMILRSFEYKDTTYINAEHHLTSADRPLDPNAPFRLSTDHFWKISIADTSKVKFKLNLEYSLGSDPSLLQSNEDSLQLFWRPNGNTEWTVYPFYKKINTSQTDKYGRINLSYTLSGDYVFGNIDPASVRNHELIAGNEMISYPNPVSNQVNIQLPESLKNEHVSVQLFTDTGDPVSCSSRLSKGDEISINLNENLPAGNFIILIYSDKKLIGHSKFVKVN